MYNEQTQLILDAISESEEHIRLILTGTDPDEIEILMAILRFRNEFRREVNSFRRDIRAMREEIKHHKPQQ